MLLTLDVHRVVGYRLRGDFLEPVGRLCRDCDHIAFAHMVGRSTFERRSAHLIGRGPPGVDHSPSHDQRRLPFDKDEHVVGMVVGFNLARLPPLRQNDQAGIAHDWPAFGHYFRNLVVTDVVDCRWDTAGK